MATESVIDFDPSEINEWKKWASTTNIHPSVIAFVAASSAELFTLGLKKVEDSEA